MDKIPTLLKITSASICLFLSLQSIALAQNSWSFEDNPYPKYVELSGQEIKYLESEINIDDKKKSCELSIQKQYQIYQNHYPEYIIFANDETHFHNWKLYMVKSKEYISCMVTNPMSDLVDSDSSLKYVHFYFCGRFSREPISKEEKEIASRIKELFEYAKTGDPASVDLLLYANERTEIINLIPEVEYYFSKLAKPFIKDSKPRDLSHLIPLLSKKQITFLDETVKQNNLQSVLDTTNPCKTR